MAPQTQAKAQQRLDLGVVRDAVRRLRGQEAAPHFPLPGDPPEVDTPATAEPREPALVESVPQPESTAEVPDAKPPKQTEVPLMGLTEATTQAVRGNPKARVVRPRMRRR